MHGVSCGVRTGERQHHAIHWLFPVSLTAKCCIDEQDVHAALDERAARVLGGERFTVEVAERMRQACWGGCLLMADRHQKKGQAIGSAGTRKPDQPSGMGFPDGERHQQHRTHANMRSQPAGRS